VTDRGPLFYDFIRSRQQIRRNRYSNLFRRLQVDRHLKLCGQFRRHVGGLGAFQDLVDVHGKSPVYLIEKMPNDLISLSSLGDCQRSPCRLQIEPYCCLLIPVQRQVSLALPSPGSGIGRSRMISDIDLTTIRYFPGASVMPLLGGTPAKASH